MICVDASVLVRCLTNEEGNSEALSWLYSRGDEEVVAPSFLPLEIGTALRRKMMLKHMASRQCTEAMQLLRTFGIRYVSDDSIFENAFSLAGELSQPTVYDTAYLAVALLEGCELWTLDLRFVAAAGKRYPCIRTVPQPLT